jgi:hypothetical protein
MSKAAFGKVIADIKNIFPRRGGNNWKIPKMHEKILVRKYVQKYGNACNFYGGWGERAHIDWVKDNGLHMQRHARTFIEQVGERISEGVIIDKTEETLISSISNKMYLLSLSSSHLRNKVEGTNYCIQSLEGDTNVTEHDFRGSFSATVVVEETYDKDHLGEMFLSENTFKSSVTWKHKNKQTKMTQVVESVLNWSTV